MLSRCREEKKLTLGRMFETAVDDSSEKLRLQKEIAETSRVNTDVRALFVGSRTTGGSSRVSLFCRSFSVGSNGRSFFGSVKTLVVGVVNEIFFAGHDVRWERLVFCREEKKIG